MIFNRSFNDGVILLGPKVRNRWYKEIQTLTSHRIRSIFIVVFFKLQMCHTSCSFISPAVIQRTLGVDCNWRSEELLILGETSSFPYFSSHLLSPKAAKIRGVLPFPDTETTSLWLMQQHLQLHHSGFFTPPAVSRDSGPESSAVITCYLVCHLTDMWTDIDQQF